MDVPVYYNNKYVHTIAILCCNRLLRKQDYMDAPVYYNDKQVIVSRRYLATVLWSLM